MHAELDDTELQLRDSLARWLADRPDRSGRGRADAEPGAPPWRDLARDLGLLGAGFPEAAGGLGGGLRAHLLIAETLGEALAAEPYLSAAVIAGGLLHRDGGQRAAALCRRLIEGEALVAWAHVEPGMRGDPAEGAAVAATLRRDGGAWRLDGHKTLVQAAPWATHLLASARGEDGGLRLVLLNAAASGVTRRDLRALDGGWSSELRFDAVRIADTDLLFGGADATAEVVRALDEATLGVCAEALGVTRRLLADTVAHAHERRQFGAPIASFQVLQHRIADMHIAREQAEALTWAVVGQMDAPRPQRALAVSSAKVAVNRACRIVGQGAVQIHGAMGITEELAVGRFFRRATQIECQFGSTRQHLRRIDGLQQGGA